MMDGFVIGIRFAREFVDAEVNGRERSYRRTLNEVDRTTDYFGTPAGAW